MKRRTTSWRLLVGLMAGFLALTVAATRAVAGEAATVQPAPQNHQILVMLKLMPDHLRGQPGYGADYGSGLAAEQRRAHAQQIARRHGLTLIDGWPMPLLQIDCYVMQVAPSKSVEQAVAEVSKDPEVAWSEPMQLYRTQGGAQGSSDPLFAAQPAATEWRLDALHRVTTGRDVTVAVVDSRIEVNHPDLVGQIVANEDFVLNGGPDAEAHGTGVAGIIAAKADNGIGIAGVAPGARLMALRACWQVTPGSASPTLCDSLSLARAINFAIEHKAQIINLSLSGPPDALIDQLLTLAKARRIAVVAAFDPTLPKGGFPASQPGVIAVADKTLSPLPALVYGAPGRDIPTTQPGGKWYLVNGSSYAAAHVSGLMALVRQFDSSPTLVATGQSGGVIDACATVRSAAPSCVCDCTERPRAGLRP